MSERDNGRKRRKQSSREREMVKFICSSILVIVAVLIISSSSAVNAGAVENQSSPGWLPAKPTCGGSIAECLSDAGEFELDSESNRRILQTTQYISYEALKRNSVPCSRRGASYYNCQAGAQANPYNRGCSAITRCRS